MTILLTNIPIGKYNESTNDGVKFLMLYGFPIVPLNISKYSIDRFESGLSQIAYLTKLKLYTSFIDFIRNDKIFSEYVLSFDTDKTYQYHIKNKSSHARYDYHEIDKLIKQFKL